jgi:hypothetical protein
VKVSTLTTSAPSVSLRSKTNEQNNCGVSRFIFKVFEHSMCSIFQQKPFKPPMNKLTINNRSGKGIEEYLRISRH